MRKNLGQSKKLQEKENQMKNLKKKQEIEIEFLKKNTLNYKIIDTLNFYFFIIFFLLILSFFLNKYKTSYYKIINGFGLSMFSLLI